MIHLKVESNRRTIEVLFIGHSTFCMVWLFTLPVFFQVLHNLLLCSKVSFFLFSRKYRGIRNKSYSLGLCLFGVTGVAVLVFSYRTKPASFANMYSRV